MPKVLGMFTALKSVCLNYSVLPSAIILKLRELMVMKCNIRKFKWIKKKDVLVIN